MNTLREKSRMSSRQSYQKKKDHEAINKAKTLIVLKSAEESQSAKSVDSDDVTSDIETKVIEDETTLVVKKAKEANVLIEYIDLNTRKNKFLQADKFGMGVFSKAYSYQILAATQRLTQKLNQNNTSFIGSPKKMNTASTKKCRYVSWITGVDGDLKTVLKKALGVTTNTMNDMNVHCLTSLFDHMIKSYVKNPECYETKFGILRTVNDGRQVRIL